MTPAWASPLDSRQHHGLDESRRSASTFHWTAPTKTHKTADGTDCYTIKPLGDVPYLALDDGRTLHKDPAIVQYLADQVPNQQLAPVNGSWERSGLTA